MSDGINSDVTIGSARKLGEIADPNCPRCGGRGWLCEAHPDKPFEHDDCPGPGDPCPLCNELARDYRG